MSDIKIVIDTDNNIMSIQTENEKKEINLYSKEAFEAITEQWVKIGWDQKYTYTFSWFGRPIVQLPEDMIRVQEVIYNLKPDVIVETGIAHGGSLIYYASLLKAMGKGRVVGIDIDIRPHNRIRIEEHELFPLITLIEGSSTDRKVFEKIKSSINDMEKVIVLLDSCHSEEHVYNELKLYSALVSKGSYLIVEDGVMEDLWDVPRGQKSWRTDNPVKAVEKFLNENSDFILETPKWIYNESSLEKNITHWNKAWLRKIN